jgi:hypothetical protein
MLLDKRVAVAKLLIEGPKSLKEFQRRRHGAKADAVGQDDRLVVVPLFTAD